MESKRVGNLEIGPATYFLPKDKWPEKGAYNIYYYYPNIYYGRESEYIFEDGWYLDPKFQGHRIHKDCFKNPEVCMSIASFEYDDHEGCYEFEFIGDRPLDLNQEEKKIFWELIEYGFKNLNGI